MSPDDQAHYVAIREEYPEERRADVIWEIIDYLDIARDDIAMTLLWSTEIWDPGGAGYHPVETPWRPSQVLDLGEESCEDEDPVAEKKRQEWKNRVRGREGKWRICVKDGQPTQRAILLARCVAWANVLVHPDPDNPKKLRNYQTGIRTTDDKPVLCRPRRYNDVEKAFMKAKARIGKRERKVEPAEPGAWASALVLIPYRDRIEKFKEKWGEHAREAMWDPRNEQEVATFYRQTIDCREVNAKTLPDVFPLPRIDDLLDQVKKGTKHFSVGDIKDAFWVVDLEKGSRAKFAYRTHDEYLQPTRMVQGGRNSANEWARIVAETFQCISQEEALVYQDDVMVHSREFWEHYGSIGKVFQQLESKDLVFKVTKVHLNYPSMAFLGFMVDEKGKYPNPEKVKAIDELEYPKKDVSAVRAFIGLTLYYRHFIKDYASIVAPLHDLTRKGVNVAEAWNEEHEEAVDRLKEELMAHPCLRLVDNTKPFQVRVDACRKGRGIGAILLQQDDEEEWHPVAYWSKILNATEREYSPTEIECKALHDCMMYWDLYLRCANEVDVYTDHNALVYMYKGQTASNNGRLMRYLLDLMGMSFHLHYKQGTKHMDADAVSRLLRKGEEPQYLTADDLEWDKGVVTEEDILLAQDMERKRAKRIARAEKRRAEVREAEEVRKQYKEQAQENREIRRANVVRGWQEGVQMTEEERRRHVSKYGRSDRTLREKPKQQMRPAREVPHRDDWKEVELDRDLWALRDKKATGYNRVTVMPSTLRGAGRGLFATKEIREDGIICEYDGERWSAEEAEQRRASEDTDYVFAAKKRGSEVVYVDAKEATSCWGRFANDPLDDTLVNAKIVMRGKRLFVVATTEILPGEEVLVSYGNDYWMERLDKLEPEQAARVRGEWEKKEKRRMREGGEEDHAKGSVEMARPEEVTEGTGRRRRSQRMKRKERKEREEAVEIYAYDNVLQCEELAEELQFLVGRKFVDDENGHLYEVRSIFYSKEARAAIVNGKDIQI